MKGNGRIIRVRRGEVGGGLECVFVKATHIDFQLGAYLVGWCTFHINYRKANTICHNPRVCTWRKYQWCTTLN